MTLRDTPGPWQNRQERRLEVVSWIVAVYHLRAGNACIEKQTGLLATLPLVLLFLVFQRQFVAGLLGGAVKG
ncbi:hypothetical protein [Agromyces marinus]|uniref:Uncharacterized protein n=1 Tax=Agromyces marinus TaxID=1389020 RepID=A0ABM8H1Q2_9MICO|nr:hypothetical protein [Agromyces marinus]BDZ54706.1 hypothetical protein GCM10025870_17790 [Agromyces marinus]